MTPDDLLHFIELPPYRRRWDGFGLTDEDLAALQHLLIADPDRGTVIEGTGGLRKVRFAPPGTGKRGGYRVCYAHFPQFGVILLVLLYKKGERDDIPAADRAALRHLMRDAGRLLERRRRRFEGLE